MLNNNIFSTCPHSTVNFGALTAEIGWRVWGTPANFKGFRVLASLLHRRRSTEVNQTLHGVWPSHGLVHYIYIFQSSCPLAELCQVQNSLCVQVLLYWQRYCTALEGCASAKLCGIVQGMELRNFRSSLFSTEGDTCIPRVAITLDIGPHSSYKYLPIINL